jgi:hypothetical protein
MLRGIVAALAAVLLAGCVSTIQGAYDEHAREECERETSPRDRGACLDRVDQNRRDRP